MLSAKAREVRWLLLGLILAFQVGLGCAAETGADLESSDQGVHRASDQVWDWFTTHTFNFRDFVDQAHVDVLEREISTLPDTASIRAALQRMLNEKGDQKIALGVPLIVTDAPLEPSREAFEGFEVPNMLRSAIALKNAGLIDDIYLIHGRQGETYDAAKEVIGSGAIEFHQYALLESADRNEQMGLALEKALQVARTNAADILVWADPEVGFPYQRGPFALRFICGVLGPLLRSPDIDFAKGYYEQSIEHDAKNALVRTGGGRITELTVRPLLNVFYPELSGFVQPLSSEFAVRMGAIPTQPFVLNGGGRTLHGAMSGVMIDVLMKRGAAQALAQLDRMAQVNLSYRFAKNPGLPELSERSVGELDSIVMRAQRDRRITFASRWPALTQARNDSVPPNRAMLRLVPTDPFPDPRDAIYTVTKQFQVIPPTAAHAIDLQSMTGWQMGTGYPLDDQSRHTFSHSDFIEPSVREDLKTMPQAELDQRFNSGIDRDLIADAVQLMVEKKNALGVTISLGLPALNEGKTIAQGIRSVKPLLDAGLIDQLVVIDSQSIPLKRIDELTEAERFAVQEVDGTIETEPEGTRLGSNPPPGFEHLRNKPIGGYVRKSGTVERALAEGVQVVVHQEIDIHPSIGSRKGKGEALWKSLKVLTGDIVAWIDTDITNPSPRFVYGLLGPLLFNPDIVYVKGFYERPISLGGVAKPTGGGRVTELMARPLLNYLYPELAGLTQPLSGEFAGRRDALMQIPFYTGYGIESSMLIDLVAQYGRDALAQVDLEVRHHKNQDLQSLSKMAFAIADVILQRAASHGRIGFPEPPNRGMWRLRPLPPGRNMDEPYIPFNAGAYEVIEPDQARPPMSNYVQ